MGGCWGCFGLGKPKNEKYTEGRNFWEILTGTQCPESPGPPMDSKEAASTGEVPQELAPQNGGDAFERSVSISSEAVAVPGRSLSERDDSNHHVTETHHVKQAQDCGGHKMVNQYQRIRLLGSGSYAKVVLHRNVDTGELFAIKICHKSRLRKLKVAPEETALMDVMREVAILKQLDHPNVVRLVEVIDAAASAKLYMVLEYVEGGPLLEDTGPPGGIGRALAQRYLRDLLAGLVYLHQHNIVHGDIKPENLLLGADGHVKISDFGVSHMLEGDDDELRRSPGTPVYTAPECCLDSAYHGKLADVWAVGCTLYVMVLGAYPFLGDSLAATYDKIMSEPLHLPEGLGPDLADLLRGLLQKDPKQRVSLEDAAQHPFVTRGLGPIHRVAYKGISVNDELIASAFSRSVSHGA